MRKETRNCIETLAADAERRMLGARAMAKDLESVAEGTRAEAKTMQAVYEELSRILKGEAP